MYAKKLNCNLTELNLERCEFQKRLTACNVIANYKKKDTRKQEWNALDIANGAKQAQFIFIIILPMISVLAIILNLLTIWTVHGIKVAQKIKEPNQPVILMYDYMQWNGLFNSLYSFLFVFKPATICIDFVGIFCSSVWPSLWTQYFKIIGLNYFGTVLRICSNLSALAASIDRFVVNNDKIKWKHLKKFDKIPVK